MCVTAFDDVIYPEFAAARLLHRLNDAVGPQTPGERSARTAAAWVQIRPFQLGDAPPMYQAARESMEQLSTWMTWCQADFSLAQAESFVSQCARAWARGEHYSFAIIDARDGAFLGSVGLNHLNHPHKFANVGYWVRNSAVGRGVAAHAARLVTTFGLQELGLNRLEFLIPSVNVASQRVAQKLGAKFEGVLRQRLLIAGRSHDAVMYALTKADALAAV